MRSRRPGWMRTAVVPSLVWIAAFQGCEAPQPPATRYPHETRGYDAVRDLVHPMDPPPAPREPRVTVFPDTAPPPPPVRIGDDALYGFEFRDTPAADALRLIADRADLNFVVPAAADGLVSASLPRVTLDQALAVVLSQIGMQLVETDGVYSFEPIPKGGVVTRVYQPRSVDLAAIEPQLQALLGSDDAGLTVNPQSNVAFAAADPDTIARIDEFMLAIDAAPREVLIEARILEVSLDERHEFGVSAAIGGIDVSETTSTFLTDFLQDTGAFTVATIANKYDLTAVLSALQEYGRLHVIASPRVLALNQELAQIEILQNIPYIQSTNTTTGDENGVSTSSIEEVQFQEIGIKLHVTPVLGEGDEITLKVVQEVSELIDFFNGVPVTDERKVDTRFVVNDRETIVIGGLLKERTRQDESGIPYLMDIPWIGNLFSGTTTIREKVELLVLITPRIVKQGEVTGVSSEYKREFMNKSREYRQQGYREFMDDVP